MRIAFWTFLDILKMSIFGFLEIIFFRRTEKSGTDLEAIHRCNSNADFETRFSEFFENFGKSVLEGLIFGHS